MPKTLKEQLKAVGISRSTYTSRLKRGWRQDRALNTPVDHTVGRPKTYSEPKIGFANLPTNKEILPTTGEAPRKLAGTGYVPEIFNVSLEEIQKLIGNIMLENAALKNKLRFLELLKKGEEVAKTMR